MLTRQPGTTRVLHTTTGAPAESRFWEQAGARSREEYAAARRQELQNAVAVFGLRLDQLDVLPFGDRDLPRNLVLLVHALRDRIRAIDPALIYTHSFEGGHPDHDSTCYAVNRALQLLQRTGRPVPEVRECGGYHARDGEFFSDGFLPGGGEVAEVHLSQAETLQKQRALDAYRSQQRVIQRFALSPERWRPAGDVDFRVRPHAGELYYEIRKMGYRFEDFVELVAEADRQLGVLAS